jgi:hypothetical protein
MSGLTQRVRTRHEVRLNNPLDGSRHDRSGSLPGNLRARNDLLHTRQRPLTTPLRGCPRPPRWQKPTAEVILPEAIRDRSRTGDEAPRQD